MKKHSQHGSTLVEFALAIPLLALMLFGIIQYGFIFAAYTTVRNGSAVGAHRAILKSYPSLTGDQLKAEVKQVVRDALSPMLKVSSSNPSIDVTLDECVGSDCTAKKVQVTYQLPLIIPFVVPGKSSGDTITISATTIMR